MEQSEIDKPIWRPTNPHDRFCRRTVFHPFYAPDFLKSYGDPVLLKFVDLDALQEAPTIQLTAGLKKVIMDAALTTRLLTPIIEGPSMSEVLLHLEHKSRPSRTAVLQLLAEVGLSLHSRWVLSGRPESGTFDPPIPLMVVVYNGVEAWDGEIWFQDLFPSLPEELRLFVPQFRVFFINLRRCTYGNLPGRPETRAAVESLMRGTDGTFIEHLPGIFTHVAEADLDEHLRLDLMQSISSYGILAAHATSEQIISTITNVFKRKEYFHMIETIKDSIMLEGIAIGEARGEERGKIDGKFEGKAEIARNMKRKGYSVKDIADLTGLTFTEIGRLD